VKVYFRLVCHLNEYFFFQVIEQNGIFFQFKKSLKYRLKLFTTLDERSDVNAVGFNTKFPFPSVVWSKQKNGILHARAQIFAVPIEQLKLPESIFEKKNISIDRRLSNRYPEIKIVLTTFYLCTSLSCKQRLLSEKRPSCDR